MFSRLPNAIAILSSALLLTGCGANIELQRADVDLAERFESSRFFLVVEDGSTSKPDNWDGHLNLLWTSDNRRKEVVAENIQRLKDKLIENGFIFVDGEADSSVLANLKFKSVRFDPTMGWITDDAQIAYLNAGNNENLGTVVADEIWITPKVKTVIDALIEGSLELWGQARE